MRELIKSMTGASWAMALCAAQQLASLLRMDRGRPAAAFDAGPRAGLGGEIAEIFRAGERLQSEAVHRLFGMLGLGRDPVAAALGVIERSTEALGELPDPGYGRRELANKIVAFRLFRAAECLPGAVSEPLPVLLEEAASRGPYDGIWIQEGLGFVCAEHAWRGVDPRALPGGVLNVLHPGLGTAIAMRLFAAGDPRSAALRPTLERFIARCKASSVDGFWPAAFEALGIVIRNLHPHLLAPVDRELRTIDRELVEYFWHGVGRALYFAPTHVPPGRATWARALAKARREPPRGTGQANALAGWAWALTLTNFRHPQVLESLLADCADGIFDHRAFAHGVGSAALVWYGVNGREAYLGGWLGHRPEAGVAALWEDLVKEAIETALDGYRDLERAGSLATLYRYDAPEDTGGPGTWSDGCRRPVPAFDRVIDGIVSRTVQTSMDVRPARQRRQEGCPTRT